MMLACFFSSISNLFVLIFMQPKAGIGATNFRANAINLSAAKFSHSFFMLSLTMLRHFLETASIYNRSLCTFYETFSSFIYTSCQVQAACMSIDRLMATSFPAFYVVKMLNQRFCYLNIFMWFFCLSYSLFGLSYNLPGSSTFTCTTLLNLTIVYATASLFFKSLSVKLVTTLATLELCCYLSIFIVRYVRKNGRVASHFDVNISAMDAIIFKAVGSVAVCQFLFVVTPLAALQISNQINPKLTAANIPHFEAVTFFGDALMFPIYLVTVNQVKRNFYRQVNRWINRFRCKRNPIAPIKLLPISIKPAEGRQ